MSVRLARPAAGPVVGNTWRPLLVARRGSRPLRGGRLVLVAIRGQSTRSFRASPTGRAGTYAARVVFSSAGAWRLSARLGRSAFRLGSVSVRPAPEVPTEAIDVALLRDGSLIVADVGGRIFRRRSEGRLEVSARMDFPVEVAPHPQGGYGVVSGNRFVRHVGENGTVRTLVELQEPTALAFDAAGNVLVSELGGRIRRVEALTGAVTTIAGVGGEGYGGDGGPATSAQLNRPHGLAVAADGTVLFCDAFNNRIRAVDPAGTIRTIAGPADLSLPVDLALGPDGSVYVAEFGGNRIRRIFPDGRLTTVATLTGVDGVAVDPSGTIYATQRGRAIVSRVDGATGAIGTVIP